MRGFIEVHDSKSEQPILVAVAQIRRIGPMMHTGDPLKDPHRAYIDLGQLDPNSDVREDIVTRESYEDIRRMLEEETADFFVRAEAVLTQALLEAEDPE